MNRKYKAEYEIYNHIKNYNLYSGKKVLRVNNIRQFCDCKLITRKEMGDALQELKRKNLIFINPKYGWIAR